MKRLLLLVALLPSFFLTSSQDSSLSERYGEYYQYVNAMKGIEIYCWNNNGNWESGLTYGTNRLKTVEEIQRLQEELPCPLEDMKEILTAYTDNDRDYAMVAIVSMPPKEDELKHTIDPEDKETYIMLYTELGLTIPEYF